MATSFPQKGALHGAPQVGAHLPCVETIGQGKRSSVHPTNLMLIYTRKCLATSAGLCMRICPWFPQQTRCCWGLCTLGVQYELKLFGRMEMPLQYLQQRMLFLREVSAGIPISPGFLLMPFYRPVGSEGHQVQSLHAQDTMQSKCLAKQPPHLSQASQ